jgi:hypothetical protein
MLASAVPQVQSRTAGLRGQLARSRRLREQSLAAAGSFAPSRGDWPSGVKPSPTSRRASASPRDRPAGPPTARPNARWRWPRSARPRHAGRRTRPRRRPARRLAALPVRCRAPPGPKPRASPPSCRRPRQPPPRHRRRTCCR